MNGTAILKSLTDPTRVRILAQTCDGPQTAYRYSRKAVVEALRPSAPTAGVEIAEDMEAFDAKVLGDFMAGGRLKQIPARWKKKDVILRFLAQQFEADRAYPEQEVNFLLLNYHPDYATLRRAMVDTRLMERRDGIYRRVQAGRLI